MNWDLIFLCLASAVSGAINSIAGGGTLITFPVMVAVLKRKPEFSELATVVANQTTCVALMPGSFASAWAYRRELTHSVRWLKWLVWPSLLGGWLGSLLVIWFPKAFDSLVPWLIFTAALLFALQPQIARWTGIGQPHENPSGRRIGAIMAFQFLVAVYGGYFGAGIGILMLSALALMGLSDIHAMNALKTLLAAVINVMSVVVFATQGQVDWHYAWPMIGAAIVGGYLGAAWARKIDRGVVRRIVVVIGFALAAYYFYHQFAPQMPITKHQ